MAYNNLDDINFFERTVQERANIENICRNCEKFTVDLYPICNDNSIVLVFSQLKKFQECPLGKW